ncbi:MAG: hypothetical protein HYZ90_01310, partial [Candidatus Omnitrophica bacterium]|nr:hypothetical protein [Candidatus Omnitrophota bacterium]
LNGRPGTPCPDGFRYSSDTNPRWLKDEEIRRLVSQVQGESAFEQLPTPTEPHFIVGG